MERKHNSQLTPVAKKLRKEMTKEERHLWYDFLRDYPVKFYRQRVIGQYVVDFYCSRAKMVIELDGSQHYEPDKIQKDNARTEFLQQQQLSVIRIPNNEVSRNFSGVCEHIHIAVCNNLNVDPDE